MLILRHAFVAFLTFSSLWSLELWAQNYPFDQRQIVLLKQEAAGFPDQKDAAAIMDVFVKRGRVRWVTAKGSRGSIDPVELPGDFAWQSPAAVRRLGLRYKSDGMLLLFGDGVKIDLRWYSTSDGLPLFFDKVELPQVKNDQEWKEKRRSRLESWAHSIWDRIPGLGFVTSRDGSRLGLEGVWESGLDAGQQLDIIRVLELKRHPVLKTVVAAKTNVVGQAQVTSAARANGRADVAYESQVDLIREGDRYQKANKENAPEEENPASALRSTPEKKEEAKKADEAHVGEVDEFGRRRVSFFENTKKILDLTAGFSFGQLRHAETISSSSYSMRSKSFVPGFHLDAKMYVTRAWIVGGAYDAAFGNFTNVDPAYGVSSLGSGVDSYRFYGAYKFLMFQELPTPVSLSLGGGYRSWSMSMENGPTNFSPTAKTVTGIEFMMNVDFPIYKNVGGTFSGSRMLGSSISEKPLSSGDDGSPVFWTFSGGLDYTISKEHKASLIYSIEASTVNFDGQGEREVAATSSRLSRRAITLGYTRAF